MNRNRTVAVVISFAALANAASFGADSKQDPRKQAIEKYCEQCRIQITMRSDALITLIAEGKPQGKARFRSKAERDGAIRSARVEILSLNSPRAWPKMRYEKPKIGAIGRLHDINHNVTPGAVFVKQIIDTQNLIGEVVFFFEASGNRDALEAKKFPFWVKAPTKNLTDDSVIRGNGIFLVSGTKQYTTVLGGTRTVLVLEDVTKEISAQGPFAAVKTEEDLDAALGAFRSKAETSKNEKRARRTLDLVKKFIKDGEKEKAQKYLQQIIDKYPKTKAASDAKALLGTLE